MSYETIVERVAAAADRVGRSSDEITIVAVSKSMGVKEILSVYDRGHRDFGENRAQEMAEKAVLLPADIRWHFIGSLQTNKARLIRANTYLLHSMDRDSLASSWLKGPGLPSPVLVQVNVGLEPQKSGIEPGETAGFVSYLTHLGLQVIGLMAIPPAPERAEQSRPFFAALRDLRDDIQSENKAVSHLSMGMTDDFEVAIEEGSSMIRVGRAIFGPRRYSE